MKHRSPTISVGQLLLRSLLAALASVLFLAVKIPDCSADIVVGFDPLTSTQHQNLQEYIESGFRFSGNPTPITIFGSSNINQYSGSPAIVPQYVYSAVEITAESGNSFTLHSVLASELLSNPVGGEHKFRLQGLLNGSLVYESNYDLDVVAGGETFTVPAFPVNKVIFTMSENGAQLDNFQFNAVPEPSSGFLMVSGLAAAFFFRRRHNS